MLFEVLILRLEKNCFKLTRALQNNVYLLISL